MIGVIKSQVFGECSQEMVECVKQLQNKFITKLSNSFRGDFLNKVTVTEHEIGTEKCSDSVF